jgi:hypothetical protein
MSTRGELGPKRYQLLSDRGLPSVAPAGKFRAVVEAGFGRPDEQAFGLSNPLA